MNRLTMVKQLESSSLAVFTAPQISALFRKNIATARVLLSRMAEDGILVRVKRGHYCLPYTDVLCVASGMYTPSYVSLLSAFEFYGTTTQSSRIVDTINTSRSGDLDVKLEQGSFNLRFVKTAVSNIYGLKKIYLDGKAAFIAEKEKAVVDGLLFNEYVPLDEVCETVRDGVDAEKALDYGKRSGKQVVMKRLGYLLEEEGYTCDPSYLEYLSETYVPLDPFLPLRGSYDSRWRVVDNRRSV